MRRLSLLALAGGLTAIAAISLLVYYYERPSVLRVAVTRGGADQAILQAAAQEFAQRREGIRIKVTAFESFADCARAFDERRVDLAVLRGDVSMPSSGQIVLIMRRNAALLFAPAQAGIRAIGDLRGHKVGVLRGPQGDSDSRPILLDAALAQYDVPPASVRQQSLPLHDMPGALQRREIDAVLAVDTIGADYLTEAVAAVPRAGRGQPVFIPIAEAKAIAQRMPNLESFEVVRGVFGGSQPKPAATFETLSVSTRLIAQRSLSNDAVAALTELLMSARPAIASFLPLANRIEAPPTDKGAAMPVHPGALAYFNDEQETTMEKYGDFFYIGVMALSLLGTAFAALSARFGRGRSADVEHILQRLLDIARIARSADNTEALDEIEREADELLALALARDAGGEPSVYRLTATNLALTQARHAIAERRRSVGVSAVRAPFTPRVVRD